MISVSSYVRLVLELGRILEEIVRYGWNAIPEQTGLSTGVVGGVWGLAMILGKLVLYF